MCRVQSSWYRKFVQFNLWATLYSSWILGLFPFIYASRTRKLRRSRCLVVYGIILNVLVVWIALHNFEETESVAKLQLFEHNPVAKRISQLHNILLLMTLFVTFSRNWWLSGDLGKILNMLLDLHHRHFSQFDSSECKDFDSYIIYKGSCIMLEIISMILLELLLPPSYSLRMFLGVICNLSMQLGVLLGSMQFHLAVLYIYRSVWLINRELLRLVNHLSVFRTTNSSRVHKLHYLYKRLLELNQRLVAIYDYQITLLIMSLLTVNIISIFYLLIYTISLKNPVTIFMALNFFQAMSINLWDYWLIIAVCELGMRANQGTARILKLFNDIPDLDTQLERSITDFALFASHQRLKFNHFGMFDVHNEMGFRMLIGCVLYLVYLVQFDYMNL